MRHPTLVHQRVERDEDGEVTQVVSILQITHADHIFGVAATVIAKNLNDHLVDIIRQCPNCGTEHRTPNLPSPRVAAWMSGHFIQDAFPQLTPGERELVLNGMCATCFIEVFGEEDE